MSSCSLTRSHSYFMLSPPGTTLPSTYHGCNLTFVFCDYLNSCLPQQCKLLRAGTMSVLNLLHLEHYLAYRCLLFIEWMEKGSFSCWTRSLMLISSEPLWSWIRNVCPTPLMLRMWELLRLLHLPKSSCMYFRPLSLSFDEKELEAE